MYMNRKQMKYTSKENKVAVAVGVTILLHWDQLNKNFKTKDLRYAVKESNETMVTHRWNRVGAVWGGVGGVGRDRRVTICQV